MEVYLSGSHQSYPLGDLIYEVSLSHLLLLFIKIPAVYYTLYYLIPKWLKNPSRKLLYLEAFAATCIFLLCYRGMVQLVIWPYITHSDPGQLSVYQYAARIFYSLFDLLQVVGITAAIKLFRLRIAAIKNEKNLLQEKLQSEMKHLKSQINPHFLFNMLNNIYSLARSNSDATADTVMKLSKILRYILYESGKKTIPIETELKIIDDFTELQKLRFGNKLQVRTIKNLDQNSVEIAPLLLFPLVENAFKHGNIENQDEIYLNIFLRDKHLSVDVHNPVGKASVISKDDGIGLPNLKRQLELLYRDHSLESHETEGRYYVNLRINLSTYAGFELFDSRG